MLIQMRRLVGGAVAVVCLFTTFVTLAGTGCARTAGSDRVRSGGDPSACRGRGRAGSPRTRPPTSSRRSPSSATPRRRRSTITSPTSPSSTPSAPTSPPSGRCSRADLRERAVALYRAGGDTSQLERPDDRQRGARRPPRAAGRYRRPNHGAGVAEARGHPSGARQGARHPAHRGERPAETEGIVGRPGRAAGEAAGRHRPEGGGGERRARAGPGDRRAARGGRTRHGPVGAHRRPDGRLVQRTGLPPSARDEHRRPRARSSSTREPTRTSAATSRSHSRSWRQPGSTPPPTTTTRGSVGATAAPPGTGSRIRAKACARRSSCCSTTPTETPRAANLHHPVSPYLYGSDPVAAARKFDNFFAKGWAPTWSDMGHGNWATAPNYASAVIGVYRRMVAFAQGG